MTPTAGQLPVDSSAASPAAWRGVTAIRTCLICSQASAAGYSVCKGNFPRSTLQYLFMFSGCNYLFLPFIGLQWFCVHRNPCLFQFPQIIFDPFCFSPPPPPPPPARLPFKVNYVLFS
jgi:hypothetical protein